MRPGLPAGLRVPACAPYRGVLALVIVIVVALVATCCAERIGGNHLMEHDILWSMTSFSTETSLQPFSRAQRALCVEWLEA